jgi:hypothetical protein
MPLLFARIIAVLALSSVAAAIGSASGRSQSADDGVIRVKSRSASDSVAGRRFDRRVRSI